MLIIQFFHYCNKLKQKKSQQMSFQNTYTPNGVNINVIPSFGRIVNMNDYDKQNKYSEVQSWRATKGALHSRPQNFDPSRYASFTVRQVIEDPVPAQYIHEYVERSRLSRRLGF